MPRSIALLRGINVGGNRKLPMADLAKIFTDAGAADVKTYIQSGNVVFTAGTPVAAKVRQGIQKKFGFDVELVVRNTAELAAVAKANPFLKSGTDHKFLYVAFLSAKPAAGKAAGLDPNRSPGDYFELKGSEIYLHFPRGSGRSKLTNQYFDSKLGVTSTWRNWNTVLALMEMVNA